MGLTIGASVGLAACTVNLNTGGDDEVGEAGEVGDDTSGTDGEQEPPTLARGITIEEVEINQGTRIPIGFGGDWVDGPERTGFLISSRDSLMRIHYTVDEGWEPRELEARLYLEYPDDTSEVLTQVKEVAGDSNPYSISGTFWFGLAAEKGQTVAGTRYQVELWETVGGAGANFEEHAVVNPAEGDKFIGFETIPMEIKVMIVPILYNGGTPNLTDENVQQIVDNLYEQNPATQIIPVVHDPVPYDSALNNLGALLPVMSALRSNEGADPNIYYHALVDIGSQSLGGTLGIANIANDTKSGASSRVQATVFWETNPSIAADTFTHEVGHSQGLFHVECPNADAAGPDPAYPHPNGRIGNTGFGIRRFLMYDPDDAFDYMSYCSPSWVSDWTWNKTFQRIKTLTSWDYEGQAPGEEPLEVDAGEILIGSLYPDGSTQWWTVPGAIDPEDISGRDRIEFHTTQGEVVEAWADLDVLTDGETQWIKVPMPVELDELQGIEHYRDGELAEFIDPGEVGIDLAVTGGGWQPAQ